MLATSKRGADFSTWRALAMIAPRISADAPHLTICELRSVHVERHGRFYEGKDTGKVRESATLGNRLNGSITRLRRVLRCVQAHNGRRRQTSLGKEGPWRCERSIAW
jgi:hypothetical protein